MTQGQYNELTWVVGGKEQLEKIRTIRNREGLRQRVKEGNARMREKARKEKILNTNLRKKNNELRERLKLARRNERRSRYTFELQLKDRTPIIFKYLIVIIFMMTFLTFALNGDLQLENISKVEGINQPQLDGIEYHEVQYSPNYENQFNDYEVTHLNRLIAAAKGVEQFGTNVSWKRTLNYMQSGEINNTMDTLMMIGQIIITPLNLAIQLVGLGINEINALTGRDQIVIPSLVYYKYQITPNSAYGNKFLNWWAEFVDWFS